MPHKQPLADIIRTTKYWHLRGDLYVASSAPNPSRNLANLAGYSLDEFAAIDPRLPGIMLEKQPMFSASPIPLTLEYWESEKLFIQAAERESNQPVHERFAVRHFLSIYDYEPGKIVEVECSCYRFKHTQSGTVYVFGTETRYVNVACTWLDKHHPDWQARFMIGKELELGPAALTEFVARKNTSCLTGGDLELPDLELSQ